MFSNHEMVLMSTKYGDDAQMEEYLKSWEQSQAGWLFLNVIKVGENNSMLELSHRMRIIYGSYPTLIVLELKASLQLSKYVHICKFWSF